MKPRRLLVAAVVVLAAVLAVVWGASSRNDAGLSTLTADPLATWQPPQAAGWARIEQRDEAAQGERPPAIQRSFAVQADGDDSFEAAVAAARAAGWDVHDIAEGALSPPVKRTATGRKTGASGRELRGAIVLTADARGRATTDELTIELFAPVPNGG